MHYLFVFGPIFQLRNSICGKFSNTKQPWWLTFEHVRRIASEKVQPVAQEFQSLMILSITMCFRYKLYKQQYQEEEKQRKLVSCGQ